MTAVSMILLKFVKQDVHYFWDGGITIFTS